MHPVGSQLAVGLVSEAACFASVVMDLSLKNKNLR